MSRFNLIDESWIPVRRQDGSFAELGIKEALLTAKELSGIEDPSPLVVASLYRFLLAVLYRALEGPTDIDQAKQLFRDGLPADKIDAYLEKWRDRFWLFDDKYPFGQIPEFYPKKWRSWTALAVEKNADTAKVLFDHTPAENSPKASCANIVRCMLATQTFAVSTGKSELSHTGTAPSAGAVMLIPIGKDLSDTLLFCLVPQNRDVLAADLACWEKSPESLSYLKSKVIVIDQKKGDEKERTIERAPTGVVDIYSWRTRSIKLRLESENEISVIGFASGVGYLDGFCVDPMLGYEIREVALKGSDQKVKKKFSITFEDKGLWREFDSLLPGESGLSPVVVENAVALTKRYAHRFPSGLMALGQKYYPPRPNIAFWKKELFVLPIALLGDRDIRTEIRRFLSVSEDSELALYAACTSFAKCLLGHGDRKIEQADISEFVKQIGAISFYWSRLEIRFQELLHAYTMEADPDAIELRWLKFVRVALKDAWSLQENSISGSDAWSLRALVKAEAPIRQKLRELDSKIAEYQTNQIEENG